MQLWSIFISWNSPEAESYAITHSEPKGKFYTNSCNPSILLGLEE